MVLGVPIHKHFRALHFIMFSRKKSMKVINNNDNSCTMWCFLKGFLIFCVIAAICLLSIVVTWMSGEMSDLREKLKSGQYFGFLQIFTNLNSVGFRPA